MFFGTQDHVIAKVLQKHSKLVINYLEHDSLLENNLDEKLTPEECVAAEEREKSRSTQVPEESKVIFI